MKNLVLTLALALAISTSYAASANHSTNHEIKKTTVATNNVSPFCIAIVKGDYEMVEKLIALGADVNEKSKGLTPAMYAAKFNRCEILNLLIAHGANLKSKDAKLGYTAMDFAKLSNAEEAKKIIQTALDS